MKKKLSQLSRNGILLYTKQTQQTYGQFCIAFRGGTRNESINQSGSLLSLFLLQHFNSQQNYQFLVQSSQIVNFAYEAESQCWNSIFLDDDTESAAEFLVNQAFTKKQMNHDLYSLIQQLNEQKDRISIQEIIQNTCFSQTNKLVIPSEDHFIHFQESNFTPENCLISYSGRRSHDQISQIMDSLLNINNECTFCVIQVCTRKFEFVHNQTEFKHQTIRIEDEYSSEFEVGLIFKGASIFETEMLAIDLIICEILGNMENEAGKIGINVRSRIYNHVLQYNDFLYQGGGVIQNYSDCGRFGLYLKGNELHKKEIYEFVLTELKKLRKISDYEIERAKNIAITQYYLGLEREYNLLIQETKNIILGGIEFQEHVLPNTIKLINKMQIEQRVQQLLNSQFNLIYVGKGTKTMPDEKMTMLSLSYN